MTPYLRAANVKDGVLDLSDVKEMNFTPRERGEFQLEPGDVLVTEGAGSLAAVGAAAVWSGELDSPVCFQNTLLRLRPRGGTDGRYLAWWARHAYGDRLFAAEATGVNIFHVSADRVRSMGVALPSESKQRAIADFLDAETARIDAAVSMRRRWLHLAAERFAAQIDASSEQLPSEVPLKRVARLSYGLGQPPPLSDDGVPIIRATNIDAGTINPTGLIYAQKGDLPVDRCPPLRLGEVLVVRSGALTGDSAIITSEWVGASPSTVRSASDSFRR